MKYKKIKKINCKEKNNRKTPIYKKIPKPKQIFEKILNPQIYKQELHSQFAQNEDNKQFFTLQQYKRKKLFIKQCFQNVCLDSFNKFQPQNIEEQFNDFTQKNYLSIINLTQPTVEMLLNKEKHHVWSVSQKYQDLIRYTQYLNYCLPKYGKKIILRTTNGALCLTLQEERREETNTYLIEQVSQIQSFIIQNRSFFMEKIQLHEQKYSNTSTRLSQLSKQILFLFKVYRQNHDKTISLLKEVKNKMTPMIKMQKNSNLNNSILKYYEILIKKNLKHAFNQEPIQKLNYFKNNEIRQKSLDYFFYNNKKISNQQQFSSYLKKKRPKKGKSSKFSLPTACSACFSDYYELSNPFTSCDNCFHRCHKLCFDLASQKCGYCSYQRIPKQQKKYIPWCQICKNKGQMCIKLDANTYCHLFCLLIHNFWGISLRTTQKNQNKINDFINSKQLYQSKNQNKNQKVKTLSKSLQFHQTCMDIQASQIASNPENILQNIFPSKKQKSPTIQYKKDLSSFKIDYQVNLSLSLNSQKQKQQVNNFFHPQPQPDKKKSQQQQLQLQQQQQQQKCNLCSQTIFQNLYISCQSQTCKKKYHAFCAFFEGYSITYHKEKCKYYIKNCCSQQNCQMNQINYGCNNNFYQNQKLQTLKQKRHFILNKNKIVFKQQHIQHIQHIQQDQQYYQQIQMSVKLEVEVEEQLLQQQSQSQSQSLEKQKQKNSQSHQHYKRESQKKH